MSLATEPRAFFLRALGWFSGLVLFLGALTWGVSHLSRDMRIEQTRREFAQLERMLEQFKARHGDYPAVMGGVPLLRCLLGQADIRGQQLEKPQPWFMMGVKLYFRLPDPTAPGNEIVDPWGRPYIYLYLYSTGVEPTGYLLASGGPDRQHSQPLFWLSGSNGTEPQDADNLVISSRYPAR